MLSVALGAILKKVRVPPKLAGELGYDLQRMRCKSASSRVNLLRTAGPVSLHHFVLTFILSEGQESNSKDSTDPQFFVCLPLTVWAVCTPRPPFIKQGLFPCCIPENRNLCIFYSQRSSSSQSSFLFQNRTLSNPLSLLRSHSSLESFPFAWILIPPIFVCSKRVGNALKILYL